MRNRTICTSRPYHWFLFLLVFVFSHKSSLVRVVAADTNGANTTLTPAVQDSVDWLVSLLNGADVNATEYQQRFSPNFVVQISFGQFQQFVDEVRSIGDMWSVTAVLLSQPNGTSVRIEPVASDLAFILQLSIDSNNKIDYLVLSPTLADPPTTIDQAAARLDTLGNFAYLVADVDIGASGGVCTVLMGSEEETATPIASMFKLYVLGAVVDAVHAGTIDWTQSVQIVDAYRSLPSGIVQNDPPNSTRTVRKLSELMISISDNTATDHLMALVGRSAVEQALSDYGHHMPELNKPFLFTREVFMLKLNGTMYGAATPGAIGQAYLNAGNVAERRVILSQLANSSVDTLNVSVWTRPIAIEGIEWFATPLDLCNVLALPRDKDEEAARILAINPEILDEKQLWSYIGYKGGSEPGVLGMAWYLEAGNGTRHQVVTGTVWNPDRVIANEIEAILLLGAIRDLSADETAIPTSVPTPSTSDSDSMQAPWTLLLGPLYTWYFLQFFFG